MRKKNKRRPLILILTLLSFFIIICENKVAFVTPAFYMIMFPFYNWNMFMFAALYPVVVLIRFSFVSQLYCRLLFTVVSTVNIAIFIFWFALIDSNSYSITFYSSVPTWICLAALVFSDFSDYLVIHYQRANRSENWWGIKSPTLMLVSFLLAIGVWFLMKQSWPISLELESGGFEWILYVELQVFVLSASIFLIEVISNAFGQFLVRRRPAKIKVYIREFLGLMVVSIIISHMLVRMGVAGFIYMWMISIVFRFALPLQLFISLSGMLVLIAYVKWCGKLTRGDNQDMWSMRIIYFFAGLMVILESLNWMVFVSDNL